MVEGGSKKKKNSWTCNAQQFGDCGGYGWVEVEEGIRKISGYGIKMQ